MTTKAQKAQKVKQPAVFHGVPSNNKTATLKTVILKGRAPKSED